MDAKKRKWLEIGILAAVSLGIVISYISLCFNQNIWTDEAFTVDMLNHYKTYGAIAAYTATDVHPPLYYFILKFVTDFTGVNFQVIKFMSVVPMLGMFLLGVTYVRRRFGFRVALLFLLMTAAIPCSMEYAIQMRMYAWCMFFVSLAAFAAFDAYETGRIRSYAGLIIGSVCAAYSHYFAFAAVLWVYFILLIALLVRKRGKQLAFWGASAGISVLLYLPWIPYFFKQISGVSNSYWIPEITGKVIREYFDWIFASDYPGVTLGCQIVCTIAIVWLIVDLIRKHEKEQFAALFALLIPVLVILTGIILSKLIRPIFIIRYVISAIPLLCVMLAIMYGKLHKAAYSVLVILLCLLFVMDYKDTYYDEYQATSTQKTLDYLEENMGEGDVIVYNYKIYDFIYGCYFTEDKLIYVEDLDYSANYEHIWFFNTVYNPVPNQELLLANGWTYQYVGDYGIEQNDFWLYEMVR